MIVESSTELANRRVIVSVDAMGGDIGLEGVVSGVAHAIRREPTLDVVLHGDASALKTVVDAALTWDERASGRVRVEHAEIAIAMDEKPSRALRRGRYRSSMWRAIAMVKSGNADAALSAGNTGALMAMARIILKMLPHVDRPALAAFWPKRVTSGIALDLGADVGATAEHLVNLAIMGAAMARAVLGHTRPRIGILNIGVEEVKGLENVREANRLLRDTPLDDLEYVGFVESDTMYSEVADVFVSEGFSGNIGLKAAEGTGKFIRSLIKDAMAGDLRSRLGAWLLAPALRNLFRKLDPANYNGAVLLGLNALVVKSHGSTTETGFSNAIILAHSLAHRRMLDEIVRDIECQHRRAGKAPERIRTYESVGNVDTGGDTRPAPTSVSSMVSARTIGPLRAIGTLLFRQGVKAAPLEASIRRRLAD